MLAFINNNNKHIYKNVRIVESTIFTLKTSSKVYKLKYYDRTVTDLIHGTGWRQTVEEELHNLRKYNILSQIKLLIRQKTIGFLQVFKVKYYPNRSIQ